MNDTIRQDEIEMDQNASVEKMEKETPKKVSTKEFAERVKKAKELLANNKAMRLKGLVIIFNKQTESEKEIQETKHNNGVGFNGNDAQILTSICKQYLVKKFISDKQDAIVKRKMPKYAAQLVKIKLGKIS